MGLPARRRDLPAARPRVRAARRPAHLGRPSDRGHLGDRARSAPHAPRSRWPPGLAAPHGDRAAPAGRHRRADRRRARAGGDVGRPGGAPRSGRSSSTRQPTPARRSPSSRRSCTTSSCRLGGRGPARARAVRARSCATRSARTTPSTTCCARAEAEYTAVRAEMVRIARSMWPATFPDRPPPRVRGPTSSRGACSTTSGDEHPPADRAARVLPRRARAVSRRSSGPTTSIGLAPTSRSRSAGRRCSCARSAARCSICRARSTRARRRSSRSRPSPTTGPRSRPSPTCARTTTGCSGCSTIHEAVPGHYLQGVYANRVPVDRARDLLERRVRGGLGGLRDPGDDGRGLRCRRPRAAAHPLEVLPARRDQRDHRRPDPHRRA